MIKIDILQNDSFYKIKSITIEQYLFTRPWLYMSESYPTFLRRNLKEKLNIHGNEMIKNISVTMTNK